MSTCAEVSNLAAWCHVNKASFSRKFTPNIKVDVKF